jgi:hypothetical protein
VRARSASPTGADLPRFPSAFETRRGPRRYASRRTSVIARRTPILPPIATPPPSARPRCVATPPTALPVQRLRATAAVTRLVHVGCAWVMHARERSRRARRARQIRELSISMTQRAVRTERSRFTFLMSSVEADMLRYLAEGLSFDSCCRHVARVRDATSCCPAVAFEACPSRVQQRNSAGGR